MTLPIKDRLAIINNAAIPNIGAAETFQAELLRTAQQLTYRFEKCGDVYFKGEGLNTCSPAMSYIASNTHRMPMDVKYKILGLKINNYDLYRDYHAYNTLLEALIEILLDYYEESDRTGGLVELGWFEDYETTPTIWE